MIELAFPFAVFIALCALYLVAWSLLRLLGVIKPEPKHPHRRSTDCCRFHA